MTDNTQQQPGPVIPVEAVEAAAKAIAELEGWDDGDWTSTDMDPHRRRYLMYASTALSGARKRPE